jgi:predicted nucleotidyltransferase/uncharacterized protein (DUF433 family)
MITSHPIDLIVSNPEVRGGQPILTGTSVSVADVAAAARFQGRSPQEIAEAFTLTLAEVHAALAYYYAHQSAIDMLIHAERDQAESLHDLRQRRAWLDSLQPQIAAFCQRWGVQEFALFGSVLTEDFRPESDIDVLVTFKPGVRLGWEIVQAQEELKGIFGREVDLVERPSIEQSTNPERRASILASAEVIYVA